MGIFFAKPAGTPVLKSTLMTALKTEPKTVQDFDKQVSDLMVQMQKPAEPSGEPVKTQFLWKRAVLAAVVLVVIGGFGFVAAIMSETHTGLKDWNILLIHSFEIILGIVAGVLGAEAVNK